MPRRVSLPAADELFRTTGGSAVQPSAAPQQSQGEPRVPSPAGEPEQERTGRSGEHATAGANGTPSAAASTPAKGPAGTGSGEHKGREQQASGTVRGTAEPDGRDAHGGQGGADGPGTAQYAGGDQSDGLRTATRPAAAQTATATGGQSRGDAKGRQDTGASGRRGRGANRRPSGRERHDEKITVYVSAEELMDLEHARLVLRGEHGLAVDRGRIVREAVAVVLADLESRGDASILVRRLRGR